MIIAELCRGPEHSLRTHGGHGGRAGGCRGPGARLGWSGGCRGRGAFCLHMLQHRCAALTLAGSFPPQPVPRPHGSTLCLHPTCVHRMSPARGELFSCWRAQAGHSIYYIYCVYLLCISTVSTVSIASCHVTSRADVTPVVPALGTAALLHCVNDSLLAKVGQMGHKARYQLL